MARAFSVEDGGLQKFSTVKSTSNSEYIDIDLSFAAKGAGDVYKKTAVSSVMQSLKNLLMTNRTEKPFAPYFGANLQSYLFELMDQGTMSQMENAIIQNIRAFEPRINSETLQVIPETSVDGNSVTLTIIFNIVNSNQSVEFTTRLNRLR
jgi:phage baseplate assembly protein W